MIFCLLLGSEMFRSLLELPSISGLSVSLTETSSSIPRIVSDVRPSHSSSTPPIPVAPCPPVSSFSLPPSIPLSDFPLLGSSRTGESFSIVPHPLQFFQYYLQEIEQSESLQDLVTYKNLAITATDIA